MLIYCPACGAHVDVRNPENQKFVRCPICGEEVCTDYEPAFADEKDPED